MSESANAMNIASRSVGIPRWIFRWIHIVFSIPILGYIYSPFDKLPSYAFRTRYVFMPIMVLSGLWMWKGHIIRRLILKRVVEQGAAGNRYSHGQIRGILQ